MSTDVFPSTDKLMLICNNDYKLGYYKQQKIPATVLQKSYPPGGKSDSRLLLIHPIISYADHRISHSITAVLPVCLHNRLLCIYFVMTCYVSGLPYVRIKYMMTWGMATAVD